MRDVTRMYGDYGIRYQVTTDYRLWGPSIEIIRDTEDTPFVAYLQGDEASRLYDELDEAPNNEVADYILSQYDL